MTRQRVFLLAVLAVLSCTQESFADTWKFIYFADTRDNSTVNTTAVAEIANRAVAEGAQFVLVGGDLANSGSAANFALWKTSMAPAYNAGIGVYPVIGNHDSNDIAAFINAFGADLPDNGPAGETNRTYALALNNVMVLGLDEYAGAAHTITATRQAWITKQLQQRDPGIAQHVFTFGHDPAFKTNHTDCLDDNAASRNTFINSLKTAGGRVYFCGHDHFYDHARIDDGDGNVNNDVHQYLSGAAGAPFYNGYSYDGVNAPFTPVNVLHDENRWGYVLVEISGPTARLTYKYRTGTDSYAASSDVFTYTAGALAPLYWDGGGADANWNTGNNWRLDSVPAGGCPLIFTGTTRQATVNNSDLIHVGVVVFSSGGFSCTGNPLTLDAGIASYGSNTWGVSASTLNAAQTFTCNASGTLTVTGAINTNGKNLTLAGAGDHILAGSISGTGSLVKSGAGRVTLTGGSSTYTGLTTVQDGVLELGENAKGGVLDRGGADLQAGEIVFDYTTASPASTIAGLLKTSYDTLPRWTTGKFQSTTSTSAVGLGWLDTTTGSKNVAVMATYYGDTNLDGAVTSSDLFKLLSKYNLAGNWSQGDTNYDGNVTSSDLFKLLSNYNLAIPTTVSAPTTVPEPGTLALLTAAGLALAVLAASKRRIQDSAAESDMPYEG